MDLPVKEGLKMTYIYVETCSLRYNTIKYLCLTYHRSASLAQRDVFHQISRLTSHKGLYSTGRLS